jgi:hemolysin activation/secretion protein
MFAPAERADAQAIGRPADERPELPEFEAPTEQEPILPPVPTPAEPRERLAAGPGVFVRDYRIVGSTVFSDEELERTVASWAGREIRSEDLVAVRNALTNHYIESGYVNSGAVIPDQDFEDGIVEVRIIEGSLSEIRISGNEQFRARYLRDRIERGAGAPLNVGKLGSRLQILQQDPRIERLAARLAPGDRPGESILFVRVEEASRLHGGLRFSNYEPPSIGALAGQTEAEWANPLGWGDTLRGQFTMSDGMKRYRGTYEVPVTHWDTRLSLEAYYSRAEVVESPFDDLEIKSRFQSYQIGLHQPLYTSPRTLLEVGVIGDWRRTKTELLDASFSFPGSGAEDGEATAAVLRFLSEWMLRDQRQVFAARSQISWGIDALGATHNGDDEPDGRFVAWLLQLQWARRFGSLGVETIFRTDLQLANAPLLTMEQIAVGGYSTVRGYRQNQSVQDQAVVSSIEVRVPIWRHPERWGTVFLAPFIDYGHTWGHSDRLLAESQNLASVGIGLGWVLPRFFSARFYWGQNLTRVDTSGDLQDHGIQFLISASLP